MLKRPHSPAPSPSQIAFIDALGGPKAVAEFVSKAMRLTPAMKPQAVSNWRRRGIPYAYRPILERMAQESRCETPKGFLEPERAPAPVVDDDEGLPFLAGGV